MCVFHAAFLIPNHHSLNSVFVHVCVLFFAPESVCFIIWVACHPSCLPLTYTPFLSLSNAVFGIFHIDIWCASLFAFPIHPTHF